MAGLFPGLRPGQPTSEFIGKIVRRITLFRRSFLGVDSHSAQYHSLGYGGCRLTIGGTALLIVVSVALETMKQVDSQLVTREYEGIL